MKIWVVNAYEYRDHIGTLAAFSAPGDAEKFKDAQPDGNFFQKSYDIKELEVQ